MPERTDRGDLAIVLHSHMPYVEGFGTYPFGEEWLFDAFARSHLPVLDVAERLTMTITPVLADQLEAEGVGERMLDLPAASTASRRPTVTPRRARPSCARRPRPQVRLYAHADRAARAPGRATPARLPGGIADAGHVVLIPSTATHAVLPKLATQAARRLQVDAGLRSHERRFGAAAEGFWLPECAYAPGLEAVLAERGLAYTCLDQSAFEGGTSALVPVRLPGGPVAFTIDWPTIQLVWAEGGYPSDPSLPRISPPLAERDAPLVDLGRAL